MKQGYQKPEIEIIEMAPAVVMASTAGVQSFSLDEGEPVVNGGGRAKAIEW